MPPPTDDQRFELLAAKDGAQTKAAKVAVGFSDHPGVGNHLLAGPADAQDGALARALFALAQHRANRVGAAHSPQRRSVFQFGLSVVQE